MRRGHAALHLVQQLRQAHGHRGAAPPARHGWCVSGCSAVANWLDAARQGGRQRRRAQREQRRRAAGRRRRWQQRVFGPRRAVAGCPARALYSSEQKRQRARLWVPRCSTPACDSCSGGRVAHVDDRSGGSRSQTASRQLQLRPAGGHFTQRRRMVLHCGAAASRPSWVLQVLIVLWTLSSCLQARLLQSPEA